MNEETCGTTLYLQWDYIRSLQYAPPATTELDPSFSYSEYKNKPMSPKHKKRLNKKIHRILHEK